MCGCGCQRHYHGGHGGEFRFPLMTVEEEVRELEEMKETLQKRLETVGKRLEVLKKRS